ncbi:unnamed protein product [Rodentolepis nana]|uniref:CYCLIN domain-containing protein n=1 Tax=Rodentolepis nana TaxID=102285 RepID=A0A158QGR2_RODNA|nr:unnamed protein product [Rodentolepis nana]
MGNCCMRINQEEKRNKSLPFHYYEAHRPTSPANITTQPNCTSDHVYYAPPYAVSPVQKSCAPIRAPIADNLDEIQHIADRELDNEESDPSISIKCDPVFVLVKNRGQSWYLDLLKRMKRSEYRQPNTTFEMFLDGSTVSKPDSRATIRAVAIAICLLIRSPGYMKEDAEEDLEIFDEAYHPMKIEQSPDENPNQPPSLKTVHRFTRKIFQNAQLSPECAIVTMIYLERLLHGGHIYLNVSNWKRILLCAILLASKVWDDQAVWNVDYCQILDELKVDDVNELERRFLEIIQFNINVPSKVYTKYYFDIRDLTVSSHEFSRLTVDTAKYLEACSHEVLDVNMALASTGRRLRRTMSLDSFYLKRRSRPFFIP